MNAPGRSKPGYAIFAAMALMACAVCSLEAAAISPVAAPADSGDDPDDAPKRPPQSDGPAIRVVRSVPYPAGAMHLDRGITGAFLGGKHQNMGEQQSLYQWQGEVGYYYQPWFSGAVAFRIKAGEPSDKRQKILNRYFLLMRFHKAWSNTAVYIGPQLGLDNLNVLDGTPNIKDSVSIIRKPIDTTNASLSLDIGGGWKFSRWVGATLGSSLEYSLVGEEGLPHNNSLNIHVSPGIAVDVLAFTESFRELVPALYINVEFQVGFLLLEKNRHRHDQAAILGIGLAF